MKAKRFSLIIYEVKWKNKDTLSYFDRQTLENNDVERILLSALFTLQHISSNEM